MTEISIYFLNFWYNQNIKEKLFLIIRIGGNAWTTTIYGLN